MTETTTNGISKHDLQSWRHHPVSKVVLRYLKEKREFIERAALDQWISGSIELSNAQVMRGQIIELAELENLQFEALAMFYEVEKEEEFEAKDY